MKYVFNFPSMQIKRRPYGRPSNRLKASQGPVDVFIAGIYRDMKTSVPMSVCPATGTSYD